MSKKCRAYSESKLGTEPTNNRKAFYAGWEAALSAALAQQAGAWQDGVLEGHLRERERWLAQEQAEPEGGGRLPPPLRAEPAQEPVAVVGTQVDVWRGCGGRWAPPGEPIKTALMLKDMPVGTMLYTAPPRCPNCASLEAQNSELDLKLAEVEQDAPVQEPVAWRYKPMIGSPWSLSDDGYYVSCKRDKGYIVESLYTAPPHRKPLAEEEIGRICDAHWCLRQLARAVERAHGIKE